MPALRASGKLIILILPKFRPYGAKRKLIAKESIPRRLSPDDYKLNDIKLEA
jgi:hypothetical protein